MLALLVEYRDPQELKANSANSRILSDAQVRQVARFITAFGFLAPVLVDEDDVIVAGVGEQVRLRDARYGDFQAKVQWVEGHEAGGNFSEQVTL